MALTHSMTKALLAGVGLLLTVALARPAAAESPEAPKQWVLEPYGEWPLHVEANQGQREAQVMTAAPQAFALNLTQGELARITGTDLMIAVRTVRDFTAEGCIGGPVGCPDHVELEVTHGKASQPVTLYVAHTQFQREQGIDQAHVFGYTITLTALHRQYVTLRVERNE